MSAPVADYHTVVLTRRGYGESGKPVDGYDTRRLASDILAVLDSLGLRRAILVGHSVAGDEFSELAAHRPERVAGLVYLDAAYDRSNMRQRLITLAVAKSLPPVPPRPSAGDKSSVAAYQSYIERVYGVCWPRTEVLATRVFDSTGRHRRDVTSPSTNFKVLSGELPPTTRG